MSTDLVWFKSSYSGDSGDSCVEVALSWRKSSYSGSSGDSCVEIASTPDTVHIRDSKLQPSPHLTVSAATWSRFLALTAP
ncbi:DUF397 domain-containing protein [Streptomyces sp. HNM0663]|uniref:DUF397 domain-containing protein n=1 Tax=Streptomyces chengmaiensis TaxID=3040919 RepID=A0ABT6HKM3_9ACTN|nr:DUF397 domain-containing protein [Streptomyces chengmaiensis]MDH2389196.1 DUF397 domain-containing protein [Streptomyces chengmaiensis]